ncbi:hypothetical protein L7F22_059967, partial [Adiantum nelumboides]|nr:hypothetical protein [Adiantum nelumboides]
MPNAKDIYVDACFVELARYSSNPYLDRLWVVAEASARDVVNTTTSAIDVMGHRDWPPSRILQAALMEQPSIRWWYSNLDPNTVYLVEFYFAEIDPAVNASSLHAFDIYANRELKSTEGEYIDVFAQVGANTAYSYSICLQSRHCPGVYQIKF